MIEQFPVGDSLHLLHLGIMKRLLFGWRDGTFRRNRKDTKWRASTSTEVSNYLLSCKMPSEFQRKIRSLEDLTHWKGTEYRMFLHYVGIVALKDHLSNNAYVHFLVLFCAITICSSKTHFYLLDLARKMLLTYIDEYKQIYGIEYISSNVHNLCHLVDEVELFGELHTFSSYDFETNLGKCKRLMRSGNRPLEQAANRSLERESSSNYKSASLSIFEPILSKPNNGENVSAFLQSVNKPTMNYSFFLRFS